MKHSMTRTDLTDEQWTKIRPLIPIHLPIHPQRRGRPWADDRDVLNGILWILRTGAAWRDLPDRYPSKATCHRRFQQWCRDGTIQRIHQELLRQLDRKNKLDWSETFVDGTFRSAKKGAHSLSQLTKASEVVSSPLWMLMAYL